MTGDRSVPGEGSSAASRRRGNSAAAARLSAYTAGPAGCRAAARGHPGVRAERVGGRRAGDRIPASHCRRSRASAAGRSQAPPAAGGVAHRPRRRHRCDHRSGDDSDHAAAPGWRPGAATRAHSTATAHSADTARSSAPAPNREPVTDTSRCHLTTPIAAAPIPSTVRSPSSARIRAGDIRARARVQSAVLVPGRDSRRLAG